jgi:hypothetical protein
MLMPLPNFALMSVAPNDSILMQFDIRVDARWEGYCHRQTGLTVAAFLAGTPIPVSSNRHSPPGERLAGRMHGLRVSIRGHDGKWPVSTIKLDLNGEG